MVEIARPGRTALRRFYQDVSISPCKDGFQIRLDDRPAKTPKGATLYAPNGAAAAAVASEWRDAGAEITADDLRLTRFAATAIDFGESGAEGFRAEMIKFAGCDLLCCRAEHPDALVRRQTQMWNPYLDWLKREIGAELSVAFGVSAPVLSGAALDALKRAFGAINAFSAPAALSAVELTGSATLGLALARGAFSADEIFCASQLEEAFQQEIWGRDEEATKREERRRADFMAAAHWLALCAES